MAKQHYMTLKSKTYLMANLANVIRGEDLDVEYFEHNSPKLSFGKVIHDMYESNPKA